LHPAQSIIDERAVDPHAAQAALDRLARRIREALVAGACALAAAVVFLVLGDLAIALPAVAGALAAVVVAGLARGDRQALIVRLISQRSAYAIRDVARAAERMATPAARRELSRSLTRLVLEAEGLEPRNPLQQGLPERVRSHAADLLAVAYLLAGDAKIHPATLALLGRLMGSPMRSPLFNPLVPEQHLRMALQRARASMQA
jgi:hypothetical protein